MTARRRIHRSALTALRIGVALLCALRLRGIARRARTRLRRLARGRGYLTLRRLAEIPRKCPCLPVQPRQLATISQKSRKPTRRERHGRQTNAGLACRDASQARPGSRSIAVCDKIRECVTTRRRAQPPQTREPAFLACGPVAGVAWPWLGLVLALSARGLWLWGDLMRICGGFEALLGVARVARGYAQMWQAPLAA